MLHSLHYFHPIRQYSFDHWHHLFHFTFCETQEATEGKRQRGRKTDWVSEGKRKRDGGVKEEKKKSFAWNRPDIQFGRLSADELLTNVCV